MKWLTLLTLLMANTLLGFTQQKSKYLLDEYGNPMHYAIASKYSKCNLFLVADSSTKRVLPFEYGGFYPYDNLVLLEGAKFIELESRIHKDSLSYYRYSVIENDTKVLVKDAVPSKIKYKWGSESRLPNYVAVDLGVFNAVNKKIEVRIYRIDNNRKVTSVILYTKPLVAPSQLSFATLGQPAVPSLKNGAKLKIGKEFKGLRITRKKTDIDLLYTIIIESNDKSSINVLAPKWNDLPETELVVADIKAKDLERSGQYIISVFPKTKVNSYWRNDALAKDLSFSVEYIKETGFSSKELWTYIGYSCSLLGLTSGLIMVGIKRKNKKRLVAEQQQKQTAQLQLNSVRAQLNPHFLFNALAGIQNLMNKNEMANASDYLRKFARLTRNVLDGKELISISQEKSLLDDYLQMEQLRFGFQYQINVAANVDIENMEIPAMLLQPFLENAVKHGIAEKGSEGTIEVAFERRSADLLLKIRDNGNGFDVNKDYPGLGLALSKSRISLLNTIYKETPIVLAIKSDHQGTTVLITLTQWL